MYTSNELNNIVRVITFVSSIIATLINHHFLVVYKNKYNLVCLIINIIITTLLVLNILFGII